MQLIMPCGCALGLKGDNGAAEFTGAEELCNRHRRYAHYENGKFLVALHRDQKDQVFREILSCIKPVQHRLPIAA